VRLSLGAFGFEAAFGILVNTKLAFSRFSHFGTSRYISVCTLTAARAIS
jgi:hypothetical protein